MNESETTNEEQTTTEEVLDEIEQRLDDAEKTELTEGELYALNLKTEERHVPTKQPNARGKRDNIAQSYAIYQYDNRYLAVKTNSRLQGEKRVRRYAIGVGDVSMEPLGLDADALRDGLADRLRADEYDASGIEEAVAEWEWGEQETCEMRISEERGLTYDGSRVYAYVKDTSAIYGPVLDALGIKGNACDVATSVISEAARVSRHPSHLDSCAAYEVGCEVTFE